VANTTTVQVGTYTALTDSFTLAIDLNDRVNWFIGAPPKGLKIDQPPKAFARSFSLRAPGETVARMQYKNRKIGVTAWLGRGLTTAQIVAQVRKLLAAIEQPPYCLALQLPGGTTTVYADVVACEHNIPLDQRVLLAGALNNVTITFECKPFLRGARTTLVNLVPNPGFEAPSGPGVVVFNDPLANFNAYAVQAGGALAQDTFRYPDAVLADAPSHYYRLDEASGATAVNATANANATLAGVSAYGVAGALTGDTDTGLTLNGTSGVVLVNGAVNLPTGANAPASLELWVKLAALPGTVAIVAEIGSNTTGARFWITIDTAGHPQAQASVATLTGAALSTGAWHHLVATYDGTSLRMYVDGALYGGPTAATWTPSYSTGNASFGAATSSVNFLAGSIDECAIYPTALSSARVSAHHTQGVSAPTSTANTMTIPSAGRVSFGSPVWGAINTWQVRWRYVSGLTATFYLHYTDANNYLSCAISGTTISLNQKVGGVLNALGSATVALVNGMQYWLQVTQFPNIAGAAAQVQASLFADAAGAAGAAVPSSAIGPFVTFDTVTALSGAPQVAATGAALSLGGNFASVHSLSLFGPGAWSFNPNYIGGGTTVASGAWDQSLANTYSGGPVTSYGAARIDYPPAGTVGGAWYLYGGGAVAGTPAMVLSGASHVLGVSAAVASSGLGASAQTYLRIDEYDVNGTLLRGGTVSGTVTTGNIGAWKAIAGTYTCGANCYAVSLQGRSGDVSVGGASANATVWFDNAQVWDQTATGLAAMPYCETRFPQTPAQLLVTGVAGDVAAPCQTALGVYIGTWGPDGVQLPFALGRRGRADANVQLVGYDTGAVRTSVLDNLSYGGLYVKMTGVTGSIPSTVIALSPRAGDQPGTYHLLARVKTADATPTKAGARVVASQKLQSWAQSTGFGDLNDWYGTWVYPFSAAGLWTDCDVGQVKLPTLPLGNLQDPTQTYIIPRAEIVGSSGTGYEADTNWQALLPIDGALIAGSMTNPSNSGQTITTNWVYLYTDGLQAQTGPAFGQPGQPIPTAATTYSIETAPIPAPGHAGGGPGTTVSGFFNVTGAADPYLTLDPTLDLAAGADNAAASGVNQFLVRIADFNGTPVQVATQFIYSPLYLWPA
jgi:hypothetical protein